MIAESIFDCSSILVPCLLILYLFKTRLSVINMPTLVLAINSTLLLGSVLFICGFVIEIIAGFFSGAEYVQYSISNRLFGSYWWAFWIEIFPGYLLPQLFWVGKFRKTIISSVIVVFFWVGIALFIKIASQPPGGHFEFKYTAFEYLKEAIIYIVILPGIYFFFKQAKGIIKSLKNKAICLSDFTDFPDFRASPYFTLFFSTIK
jgi:hypothetical protein